MRVLLLTCTFALGVVLASGCGNKTAKTSSTPLTIGGATTTVAPGGGVGSYQYSRADSDAFLDACAASQSGTRSTCGCALTHLRADTPESQLKQITDDLRSGNKGGGGTAAKVQAVARVCRLTPGTG